MPAADGTVVVAAGTNGAGKSSIVQPFIEARGGAYYNPDQYARRLVEHGMPVAEANASAWTRGYRQLSSAIEQGSAFAFETTLGGHSIPFQLMRALAFERPVVILFVGLASPEMHIERVRQRVKQGGHDIPEAKVRQRFDDSRRNLLAFVGTRATIRVWDNSTETTDARPSAAREVFRVLDRQLELPSPVQPGEVPAWARPMLAQALKLGL